MKLLVISPDFASHYGPMAVVAKAAQRHGCRVVVATGPNLRARVESDGFAWRLLQLGAGSNSGVADCDPGLVRFLAATCDGPIATIRRQALDRQQDLLWEPERVATRVARLCEELQPERVLVDHVSFGSTLAMYATGLPFSTLVPGHPSQLPVGTERYGVPSIWPLRLRPDPHQLCELETLVDQVTDTFTARWNTALAGIAPGRPAVDDAFRVHGTRLLYNTIPELQAGTRVGSLPDGHRFVGPLARVERLPDSLRGWDERPDGRPRVYVSLGTFLSYRSDVLARLAGALRQIGAVAAIAIGATPIDRIGTVPDDWVVAPQLPQVALLRSADLIVHHGGNNTVQEALAAGVRQLVLPFSTDQFSNAADLERIGAATVASPNLSSSVELAALIESGLASSPHPAVAPLETARLAEALIE